MSQWEELLSIMRPAGLQIQGDCKINLTQDLQPKTSGSFSLGRDICLVPRAPPRICNQKHLEAFLWEETSV
jgi:hypothetical protein